MPLTLTAVPACQHLDRRNTIRIALRRSDEFIYPFSIYESLMPPI
jgi:hypothetical protein